MSYESDSTYYDIDEHNLVEEARRQPKRMFEMCRELAEADADVKLLDVELELVEADLDRMIRSNPDKYGLKKVTEPGIKHAMKLTKRWQKAKKELITAETKRDTYKGGVKALEHRKESIGNIVYLNGQSYYGDPITDSKMQRRRRKDEEKESKEVISRMSKRLNKQE